MRIRPAQGGAVKAEDPLNARAGGRVVHDVGLVRRGYWYTGLRKYLLWRIPLAHRQRHNAHYRNVQAARPVLFFHQLD